MLGQDVGISVVGGRQPIWQASVGKVKPPDSIPVGMVW